MKAEDLKNSILQLAMQGQLVPQDPNDEPASVLLRNLKDYNNKSVIYNENNHYYEKIGKKKPICIDEEIPFDIPDSWELCRLDNICKLNGGFAFKSTEFTNSGIRIIRISDFDENGFKNDKIVYYGNNNNLDKYVLEDDDIIMAMTGGTVGKTFHVKGLTQKMYVNQRVADIKVIEGIATDYIYSILQSAFIKGIIHKNKNSTNDNISMKTIKSFIIPIPPINEQYRIVIKIKELMEYINNYEDLKISWDILNSDFPAKLKSSILQEAFQGKLVHQDHNDEPASVLLENIKHEKAKLVKTKKIKDSVIYMENGHYYERVGRQEPICIDNEIPFDIPDSWEWVRVSTIAQINPRNKIDDNLTVSFIPMPLINEGYDNSYSYDVKKWSEIKKGYTHFAKNDIAIAKITPCFENQKSAIFYDLENDFGAGTTELHIIRPFLSDFNKEYLLYIFKSKSFIDYGVKNFTGTAGQKRIGKKYVENYLIPVPPLNEQKRIVDKVEQLFECVDVLIDE